MKHKHHKLIKAWADGAEIEWEDGTGRWLDSYTPHWVVDTSYRVKPAEPVYEWVWTYYSRDYLAWIVTNCHLSKERAENCFRNYPKYEAIEASKREVE
tara:strand:+ start:803 stop:1096 length:294 start_codon:yes stop_codon:yes gene_type:complete